MIKFIKNLLKIFLKMIYGTVFMAGFIFFFKEMYIINYVWSKGI